MTANYTFVDATGGVTKFLDNIAQIPSDPPSLYVDLEGINLGRSGSISILQVYVHPQRCTYLLDVHALGASCFSTASSLGVSVKDLLESSAVVKVFFDVRNDSDALFSHYGIRLAGVQDLQLMELATRTFPRRHVNGLAKCIERDGPMSPADLLTWKTTKEKGVKLFAPEHGGSYAVFNQRPMPQDIIDYCVQDVELLPRLWALYNGKLTQAWRERVRASTIDRIVLSQSATYNGKGPHKALPPSGWYEGSRWDYDL